MGKVADESGGHLEITNGQKSFKNGPNRAIARIGTDLHAFARITVGGARKSPNIQASNTRETSKSKLQNIKRAAPTGKTGIALPPGKFIMRAIGRSSDPPGSSATKTTVP